MPLYTLDHFYCSFNFINTLNFENTSDHHKYYNLDVTLELSIILYFDYA